MYPFPPFIKALLAINAFVFLVDEMIFHHQLEAWFALWPLGGGFQPWQVLTYSVLHASFLHIFFNMWGVWMFGAELEQVWGSRRLAQFYVASVVAAGLTQLLVNAAMGSPYPTVGASGGLFGILMAYGMLFPNRRVAMLLPPVEMKASTLVLVYGGLELFLGVTGLQGGVAHFAHLGGMLGGWLTLRYWRGQPPFGRGR